MGLIPGLGTSLGGGDGNPLQFSCLENLMDRRAWGATAHRVLKEPDLTGAIEHKHTILHCILAHVISCLWPG